MKNKKIVSCPIYGCIPKGMQKTEAVIARAIARGNPEEKSSSSGLPRSARNDAKRKTNQQQITKSTNNQIKNFRKLINKK